MKSGSRQTNILAIIDTEYVKACHPELSKNPKEPTGLNHNGQFLMCTGSRGVISGQGTADLSFKANPNDTISFTGTSIYANSEDAVIIYGIKHDKGGNVFNQFVPNLVARTGAIMADADTTNGLPAIKTKINFSSYDSKVRNSGEENFIICFALYTLSENGENQELMGYCSWDPKITVE